ncbi:MAG: SURF1 family protein [Bordetella sp.]|nr:SURF1 family protein [Bordetella sp.]
MASSQSRRKTILALMLLAVVIAVTVSMGRWQLRRADERRAIAAAIEAGRKQAPLALSGGQDPAVYVPWRAASASGVWRPGMSVWLENRNHQGRPGYWLATPLVLADGGHAVLVLRGWVARRPGLQEAPAVPPETGPATVQGELAARVPRLFELWSLGGAGAGRLPAQMGAGPAPVLQNLDLGDYAKATGLALLPVVLMQTAPQDEAFVRDWPQPSIDYNQNQGYALQWFGFAAIAALGGLVVAWRAWSRARRRPNAQP